MVVAIMIAGSFIDLAKADPYKWCAVHGGTGSTRCYFLTIEQCRAAIPGGTSFCTPNQYYDGLPVVVPDSATMVGAKRFQKKS
jgi:uncharacterized protein DUF3551